MTSNRNPMLFSVAFQSLLRYYENRFRKLPWERQREMAECVVDAYEQGQAGCFGNAPETIEQEMHGIIVEHDWFNAMTC